MLEHKESKECWLEFWKGVRAQGDPMLPYEDLRARYSERHRHYHTLVHIMHCLSEFKEARHLANYADCVEMAIWYHDFFYETGKRARFNEMRSGAHAFFVAQEAGLSGSFGHYVLVLIEATRHDNAPETVDEKLLVDIDLAILGQSDEVFDEYEIGIRKEYAHVPLLQFVSKRTQILEAFLERDSVYATEFFRTKYENKARGNLKRSIAHLEKLK